jgi:hypothetical protein
LGTAEVSWLVLREQQVDGPYLLRYVALTTRTADAAASTRPVRNACTTQSYVADAFEGEPQQDSQWMAEAALLREHIQRMREEFATQITASAKDGGRCAVRRLR